MTLGEFDQTKTMYFILCPNVYVPYLFSSCKWYNVSWYFYSQSFASMIQIWQPFRYVAVIRYLAGWNHCYSEGWQSKVFQYPSISCHFSYKAHNKALQCYLRQIAIAHYNNILGKSFLAIDGENRKLLATCRHYTCQQLFVLNTFFKVPLIIIASWSVDNLSTYPLIQSGPIVISQKSHLRSVYPHQDSSILFHCFCVFNIYFLLVSIIPCRSIDKELQWRSTKPAQLISTSMTQVEFC